MLRGADLVVEDADHAWVPFRTHLRRAHPSLPVLAVRGERDDAGHVYRVADARERAVADLAARLGFAVRSLA